MVNDGADKTNESSVAKGVPVMPGTGIIGVLFLVMLNPVKVKPLSVEYPAEMTILAEDNVPAFTLKLNASTEALYPALGAIVICIYGVIVPTESYVGLQAG